MVDIAAQESSGAMTHAAARARARARAIGSAVQNNGMFIAGNVMKAKQAAKDARGPAKLASRRPRPPIETLPAERLPAPGEPTNKSQLERQPGEPQLGEPPAIEKEKSGGGDGRGPRQGRQGSRRASRTSRPRHRASAERRSTLEEMARELPPEMRTARPHRRRSSKATMSALIMTSTERPG